MGKLASGKKQKTEVKAEKKKVPPPKKVETSSSEDEESLSESEEKVVNCSKLSFSFKSSQCRKAIAYFVMISEFESGYIGLLCLLVVSHSKKILEQNHLKHQITCHLSTRAV